MAKFFTPIFFNSPILEKKQEEYFKKLIKETIELRETFRVVRRDMIHLFLQARRDKNISKDLTDDSITAQSLMFFSAGFANTSNALSFMSYELAINPEIQEKLQYEIDEILERCNGKFTYEALSKTKYLDMVISETLRKWPTGAILNRKCVKDYIISPKHKNENEILVKKGSFLFFPLAAIQHDPKYFPNPTKFNPERFSDENKRKIKPCTFIPMGVGPRYCIASRFAYMEIKIMFFHLLSKFQIVTTRRTPISLVQKKLKLDLGIQDGFWLGLKRRSNVKYIHIYM